MAHLPDPAPVTKVPEFVARHRWTEPEDVELIKHKKLYGRFSAHELKSHPVLGKRSREACEIRCRHLVKTLSTCTCSGKTSGRQKGKKWTPNQVLQLTTAVEKWIDSFGGKEKFLAETPRIPWVFIASKVEGRTQKQCREKWTNFFSPQYTRAPWTLEQRKYLLVLENTYSETVNKWKNISYHLNRSPDSCKNQYHVLRKKNLSDLFQ